MHYDNYMYFDPKRILTDGDRMSPFTNTSSFTTYKNQFAFRLAITECPFDARHVQIGEIFIDHKKCYTK